MDPVERITTNLGDDHLDVGIQLPPTMQTKFEVQEGNKLWIENCPWGALVWLARELLTAAVQAAQGRNDAEGKGVPH